MRSPHVLMCLTPPLPFGASWARAAARVARVTTISQVVTSPFPSVAGIPYLRQNPENPNDFEVVASPLRTFKPRRLFGHLETLHFDHQFVRSIEAIGQLVGRLDCVHTHFAGIWDLARVCRRLGIPLVHTEHASSFVSSQPVEAKRMSRSGLARAKRIFQAARTVTVVSEFLRRAIAERGLPGNITVVHNPVDTDRFRPTPLVASAPPRLISVGRLAPEKDPQLMLRAFAKAAQVNDQLSLDVLGDGGERASAEGLARELGLERRVRFLGRRPSEDLPHLLAASAGFLTATRIETFGVAVAEALSCGRPVVAPRVGALPELVTSERGVLVSPGSIDALADGILELTRDPSRWSPEGIAAGLAGVCSERAVGERLAAVYADAQSRERVAVQV